MELVSQIGGGVTNGLAYVGSLAMLAGRAAWYTFVAPFRGKPLRLARAVLPVAVVFLAWDALAIAAGVWTYNPRYVTGLRLPLRIPVEELAFFLVVPVCGILTYGCVQALLTRRRSR